MRKRPQPNRRQGLLRAVAVGVALIILLLVAVFIAGALTSTTVQAPVAPATPGPLTPRTLSTGTPGAVHSVTPAATPAVPKATPRATAASKKTSWLPRGPVELRLADTAPGTLYAQTRVEGQRVPGISWSSDRTVKALFSLNAGTLTSRPLKVVSSGGYVRELGRGDPFVRPVWSPDRRQLLYVRVQSTRDFPGERWSLVVANTITGAVEIPVRWRAMALRPLGWWHEAPLFSVANETDTSVYSVRNEHVTRVGTIGSEPIVDSTLAPSGRFVASVVPAGCSYCTLQFYDLGTRTTTFGPSSLRTDSSYAWLHGKPAVVAAVKNRLAVVDTRSGGIVYGRLPKALDGPWPDSVLASVNRNILTLRVVSSAQAWHIPL